VGERIVGIALEGPAHRFNGLRILAVLHECIGVVEEAVELRCLGVDLLQAACGIFRNSGMLTARLAAVVFSTMNGGRIMALSIDVRQHQLRVRRAALG